MSTTVWSHAQRLRGHKDSINALRFSANGQYLASGGDDGRVLLFSVASGRQIQKLFCGAPVTALCWTKTPATQLYVALADGRVLSVRLTEDMITSHYLPRGSEDGHVEDMVHDDSSRYLVCAGSDIELWRDVQPLVMAKSTLPQPTPQQGKGVHSVRSIHLANGGNSLIVSYLNHGIHCWDMNHHRFTWTIRPRKPRIGRSALSPDSQLIAVSNVSDGFDLYRTSDQTHIRTISTDMRVKIILPVLFVDGGSALVMGSSCGKVRICDVRTGTRVEELDHSPDDIIQAMAWWSDGDHNILATGPSESGDKTVINIWRAPEPLQANHGRYVSKRVPQSQGRNRLGIQQPRVDDISGARGRGVVTDSGYGLLVALFVVLAGIMWIMIEGCSNGQLSLPGLSTDLMTMEMADLWGQYSWRHVKSAFFDMVLTLVLRTRQLLTR